MLVSVVGNMAGTLGKLESSPLCCIIFSLDVLEMPLGFLGTASNILLSGFF